jgi:hypothetical protein
MSNIEVGKQLSQKQTWDAVLGGNTAVVAIGSLESVRGLCYKFIKCGD